ncbi:MAG TPA: AAA family ATPase [Solirubrobacteraceae bacterium]|nr:AAA family ATPase [Solirubrobacteraceae bacterium]
MDQRTASFLRHAREMTELGRYAEAAGLERQAREAAARAGDPPDALLAFHAQAGRRAFLQADWAEAERALREASTLAIPAGATPRDRFDVELRLGLVLHRLDRPEEAVAQLERTLALDLGPAFTPPPAVHRALAESLRAVGRRTEAEAALAEAARITAERDEGGRDESGRSETGRDEGGRTGTPPRAPLPPAIPAPRDDSFEAVFRDLDALIGLATAKAQFRRLAELLRVNQLRRGHGLKTAGVGLHMVFVGGPGTGKTTLARLVGRLYHALELLETGDVVEVTRADLVSGFVGQTAQRTNEVIDSALGKVLFIDEAYALSRPGAAGDFGPEAVAELLKRMEDDRERLAVIIAGYPDEIEAFLATNPGFASRFGETLTFDDFTPAELAEIFERSFCVPTDYRLAEPARAELARVSAELHATRDRSFANARTMRNLFDDAIAHQAQRLVARGAEATRDELMTLEPDDLSAALRSGSARA